MYFEKIREEYLDIAKFSLYTASNQGPPEAAMRLRSLATPLHSHVFPSTRRFKVRPASNLLNQLCPILHHELLREIRVLRLITHVLMGFVLLPSVGDAQHLYPLQIGNTWEYWYGPPPPEWVYAWTYRVVDDTIMPDGHTYSIVEGDYPGSSGPSYLRQEGTRVLAFDPSDTSQSILYDFSKSVGDTISVYPIPTIDDTLVTTITYDAYGTVFGRSLRLWDYFTTSVKRPFFYSRSVLADSIGIVHEQWEASEEIYLRGAVIDGIEYGTLVSVPVTELVPEEGFRLLPNYPNPFNDGTQIGVLLSRPNLVQLSIHDLVGRLVYQFTEYLAAGTHWFRWSAKDMQGNGVASGIYICRVLSATSQQCGRMILVR